MHLVVGVNKQRSRQVKKYPRIFRFTQVYLFAPERHRHGETPTGT